MDIDWCKNPEVGLPKPDLVLYLTLPKEEMESRSGFGEERYENKTTQEAVSKVFEELQDGSWQVIVKRCLFLMPY